MYCAERARSQRSMTPRRQPDQQLADHDQQQHQQCHARCLWTLSRHAYAFTAAMLGCSHNGVAASALLRKCTLCMRFACALPAGDAVLAYMSYPVHVEPTEPCCGSVGFIDFASDMRCMMHASMHIIPESACERVKRVCGGVLARLGSMFF